MRGNRHRSDAQHAHGDKVAANHGGHDEAANKCSDETRIPALRLEGCELDAVGENAARIADEIASVDLPGNNAGISGDSTRHAMSLDKRDDVIRTT